MAETILHPPATLSWEECDGIAEAICNAAGRKVDIHTSREILVTVWSEIAKAGCVISRPQPLEDAA